MFHAFFGSHSFITGDHLDKGMAFVRIDDARLDSTECQENRSQLILGRSAKPFNNLFVDNDRKYLRDPTDKQCPTEYCRLISHVHTRHIHIDISSYL